MSLSRRLFLQSLSLVWLLKYPSLLLARPDRYEYRQTLIAFLDTLMPADESPSASELQVEQRMLEVAAQDSSYQRLLLHGCVWLDKRAANEHQSLFKQLGEPQRIAIVESMEQAKPRSLPRVFLDRLQVDLFEHYYSDPRSWQGLLIDRPPQPIGYMDYSKPPSAMS